MTTTFLIFRDSHGGLVRINPAHITSYNSVGMFTQLTMVEGIILNVEHTAEEVDKAMLETYYFVKDCSHDT